MGAWGPGVFENDIACDFAAGIAVSGDLAFLERTLDRVLAVHGGYLEAPEANEALVAADIIARLKGSPGVRSSYTAAIEEWVEHQPMSPSEEVVEKARACIARILTEPSEILELWTESGELEAWKRAVEEVSERLARG
jgi:hypothetical protein